MGAGETPAGSRASALRARPAHRGLRRGSPNQKSRRWARTAASRHAVCARLASTGGISGLEMDALTGGE
ncbi:MAG: hypothetical protein HY515_01260 [Candidatus Aenigmarchaeota archaeon]|nr:hypothetical protein [Candidatus Aenigmarchaeota archaeon]